MKRLGFKDLGETFVSVDFVVDDLHTGNIVLDEEGSVRVIDAAVWLNTKEEGYAGKRVLGELPRVIGDVEMQTLEKLNRFKQIDRPLFDRLVKRLQQAIPTKVSTNFTEGRKVLKELNYDVDALFVNETMAFTPHTKKLLEKAKEMERVGKPLQDIKEQTGWFIGLDGNWKFTIDDSYARFIVNESEIDKFIKNNTVVPLKRVLIHEELDQYYPEIAKKIKVTFYEGPKDQGGYVQNHSSGIYTIRINKNFREEDSGRLSLVDVKNTLLHEVQHVVQGLDRSVRGFRKNDLGGTSQKILYNKLKRGKLKIYRQGSDKLIKYRHLSAYGKSYLQANTIGRLFFMFSSAPVQFYRHTQSSLIEIGRMMKKGQENKGSVPSHVFAILNYGIAQPMLCVWASQFFIGSIWKGIESLIDEEEEADDFDKALFSALLVNNLGTIPGLGDALLLLTDKALLEKDHTFGDFLGSPVFDELSRLTRYYKYYVNAKTEKTREKYRLKFIESFVQLTTDLPVSTSSKYRELIQGFIDGKIQDEYELIEQLGLFGGWNQKVIVDERKKRRKEKNKTPINKSSGWY